MTYAQRLSLRSCEGLFQKLLNYRLDRLLRNDDENLAVSSNEDLTVKQGMTSFADLPNVRVRLCSACFAADARNHPLLIHCNKGKHRTGCLVGCFRKVRVEVGLTVLSRRYLLD